jgi:uncharacterized protein (DUF927 family)
VISLPKTLYLIGKKDKCLGHKSDVIRFRNESGKHKNDVWVLSKKNKFKQNYNHINLLTHPDTLNDHFAKLIDWIEQP